VVGRSTGYQKGKFVLRINVLKVYDRPYHARRPMICLHEVPVQMVEEVRVPPAGTLGASVQHAPTHS
jgi:hypothetical protein